MLNSSTVPVTAALSAESGTAGLPADMAGSSAQSGQVALLGQGRLAGAISAALTAAGLAVSTMSAPGAPGPRYAAAVSATDTHRSQRAGAQAAAAGIPWLPVGIEAGWVLIGPMTRPGVPGCATCVWRRRDGNRVDAAGRVALREQFGPELARRPTSLLTTPVLAAVGALVADEVARLRAGASGRTDRALIRMALPTGVVRRHPFLPDPLCPSCDRRPPDSPAAGQAPLGPVPKSDPARFRTIGLTDRLAAWEDRLVEPETGFVQTVLAQERGGGPMAVARLAPARTIDESHHGYGRCDDFTSSRATAIVEALERVAGIYPRGRRTTVTATYREIADHALDPRTLGLYPDDWYDQPDFWFTRFDPDHPTAWVWGYSFAADRALLVPESYVYYGVRPPHDRAFAYESSNGCAIGATQVEAVLYALLEVAERDAFLSTWYCRLPLPRVDLDSATDRRIPMIAQRLRHRLGYDVTAFVATLEQGLPVFWVMAVDLTSEPHRPRTMCGTATHLVPERALHRALDELGPTLEGHIERYDPRYAAQLAADPELVSTLADHPTQYGHPDAFARLDFLRRDAPARSLAEVTAELAWPEHDDLTADLAELVGRFLATGLDVITVDTTPPEADGLASAKVIVPGAVPLTFGHRYRRVHGLPRLLTLPRRLGYRDADLRPEDLNPYPHPFP